MRQKLFVFIAILLGGVAIHQAQAQNVVMKGVGLVNLGLGINNGVLPVNVSYDHGVVDNLFDHNSALTVGALGGVLVGNNVSGILIGPRVGLHYHFIPHLDTYVSLMLGYSSTTVRDKNANINHTNGGFEWGAHLGARYLFTPKVGAFMELGYGWSFANVGVTFRI